MSTQQPLHPNHLPDLRYVMMVLEQVRDLVLPTFRETDGAHGQVAAAINGMRYIIKRTEEAAASQAPAVQASESWSARMQQKMSSAAGWDAEQNRASLPAPASPAAQPADDNQWLGDMMILQVLSDSEHVNEQEREVLTRWMDASAPPGASTVNAEGTPASSEPNGKAEAGIPASQPVAAQAQGAMTQAQLEAIARAIYEQWKSEGGWVPWAEGGNSFRHTGVPAGVPVVPRVDLMDAYRALQNTLLTVPDGKFKRDMDDWLTAKLAAIAGVGLPRGGER